MGDRHTAEHTHREAPQDCTSSGRDNTTAYSAGAVCCPDEVSARRHDRAGWRATWVDAGGPIDLGTPRFVWHELCGSYVAQYRFMAGLQRRWTR